MEAIDGWPESAVEQATRGFAAIVRHFFYEGGFSDVLGDAYERIADDWGGPVLGQYFTPWPAARMMARLTLDFSADDEGRLRDGPALTIQDPACGSGVMGLAAKAFICQEYGRSALKHVRFYGQDIDRACCLMARIQQRLTDVPYMTSFYAAFRHERQASASS